MSVNLVINPATMPIPTKLSSSFEYEVLQYVVVAVRGNTLYGISVDKKSIYKSTDNGNTWSSALWAIPTGTIQAAHLTASGAIIVIGTNGKVYRSADDSTFTEVLSGISSPLNSSGISSNGAVVCFGEYTVTDGTPIRVYQSQNDGVTWSIGLDAGVSSAAGVRHFHTCQFLPGISAWIATTGDQTINWYRSFDGITWALLFSSTNQYRRTLGVVSTKSGEIIYSSDGAEIYGGVFKSTYNAVNNKIDDTDITRMLTTTSSYGLDCTSEVMMTCTITSQVSSNKVASIYISLDGGNSWVLDAAYKIKNSTNYGGFINLVGHDAKGNFYLRLDGAEGLATSVGIKAKSFIDRSKLPIQEVGTYIAGVRKKVVQRSLSVANAAKTVDNKLGLSTAIGCIETLLSIGCNIPAIAGATSGTHQLTLTWGAGGWPGRVFTVSAAYNVALMLTPFGAGTGVTFTDGTFDNLRRMLDGKTMQMSPDTTVYIYYKNNTDADRADTATVNVVTLQESVVPLT